MTQVIRCLICKCLQLRWCDFVFMLLSQVMRQFGQNLQDFFHTGGATGSQGPVDTLTPAGLNLILLARCCFFCDSDGTVSLDARR